MEAEERPVKGRDIEENGQIDNGVNGSPTTDVKHTIEVWVSIAIAVVAIASQFALFEASSITADIAHVLFLSAVLMGMTAILVYAAEHGRNADADGKDGDGVYRSVMICSVSGMGSIPVAACVTVVFCVCLGLVVMRKIFECIWCLLRVRENETKSSQLMTRINDTYSWVWVTTTASTRVAAMGPVLFGEIHLRGESRVNGMAASSLSGAMKGRHRTDLAVLHKLDGIDADPVVEGTRR
ncbi:hypothetical protein BD410DRAFT_824019 [Rickenella mellea]|uniref:Transmembrane protein n=1 Tax=Rickenella mellea TaxID=50990 RepID=A0A4R5XIE4_9AGAM|nr:hypothetical protein BD410DRAFT_824019 [Rickenella mellea]